MRMRTTLLEFVHKNIQKSIITGNRDMILTKIHIFSDSY